MQKFLLSRFGILLGGVLCAAPVAHATPLFVAKPAQDQHMQPAPQPGVGLQPPAVPQSVPQSVPQALPLRVINQETFCTRMRQAFTQYAATTGYSAVQQTRLASSATVGIVEEFKLGRAADYVSAAALAAYSRVPALAPQDAYLPVANIVGNALGIGQNVTLALSVGELRFIPYAQRNMELVVIAHNAAALTPERAKKVAEVAQQAGIKINIVWVGGTQEDGQAIAEARSLAWLASVTGGAFANLSGQANPCAQPA